MSLSKLSPSSNLLRGSRLFALPKPLPPAFANASSQPAAHSDSATSPYPTHQAIETQPHALHRGEWGLKRPLPLKSTTKTGTPYIRIKNGIDTIEHITNFEPAADHVLTLQKFQTLNIPVLLPDERGHQGPNPGGLNSSPFEERYHSTSKPTSADKDQRRWNAEGPWIAGQSGLEFEAFLRKEVRGRRKEFRQFLRENLIAERIQQRLRQMVQKHPEDDSAEVRITEETAQQVAQDVTNEINADNTIFEKHMKELRADPTRFSVLIQTFFDLPDSPQRGRDNDGNVLQWRLGDPDFKRSNIASMAYRELGLPSTHPSAGLGYLRMASVSPNHPIYGPQSQADPIPARILRNGSKMVADNRRKAKLGVAGFVTDQYQEGYQIDDKATNNLREFVPERGGNKYPVRPSRVVIYPDGRPIMETMATRSDKVVMAGLRAATPMEDYLQRRSGDVESMDRMPRLDAKYAEEQEEIDKNMSEALLKNRQGLSSMLNSGKEDESQTRLLNDMLGKFTK